MSASSTAPKPSAMPPLLGPGDPPPVTVLNREGRAPVLLLCDHASNAMPASLGTLGLDDAALSRHIAYDIGAADVTRALVERWDAAAVLSGYSRLIIDLNRDLDDPTSIPVISDGVVVPGNRALDPAEAAQRVDGLFWPYHSTAAAEIDRLRGRGQVPAVVSIHSFTPVMNGIERPWHIGILWDRDPRMPVPVMERLRADARLVVGDNEPYTGKGTEGSTIDRHAVVPGLPHLLVEIRQDLIDTRHGAAEWAGILGEALDEVLADPTLYRIQHF
ncbi:N-formylglutamate amidohydrolase [Skermanella mucosa]|uniref:N-formylglutamate amidohydrolase n=1 Tax=Skermanella mucosa TaxID=1789672 RepID=UPI00192BB847|nr:N-formylglutamate amidohydrolase [Skermanella mucosa]UEM19979.1 N-formylglutamate amidohydrolase [Skermanella mucosa]